MANKQTVAIPAPNIKMIKVKIIGQTPLLFNKWSEKAKKMIRDKQGKVAQKGHGVRKPLDEYFGSFYFDKDGYVSFPALSIKQAIVNSARSLDSVPMTVLRAAVFTMGDEDGMIRLSVDGKPVKPSKKPKIVIDDDNSPESIYAVDPKCKYIACREDMVRLARGSSADLRYRGQVSNWTMDFVIKYNADVLSAEQVLNLLQLAGFSTGLGEWRPERDGDFGCFEIEQ